MNHPPLEIPARQIRHWVPDFDENNPKLPLSLFTKDNELIAVVTGKKGDSFLIEADETYSAKHGKILATTVNEVATLARQSAINDMCQGENNTPFHKALANVFLDFQEGKITKERYEELTDKLLKP